jgi:hypothetical protein
MFYDFSRLFKNVPKVLQIKEKDSPPPLSPTYPGMGSYVELKIVGPGESLAAQCTRIWFFLAKQNTFKKNYLNFYNFRSGFLTT